MDHNIITQANNRSRSGSCHLHEHAPLHVYTACASVHAFIIVYKLSTFKLSPLPSVCVVWCADGEDYNSVDQTVTFEVEDLEKSVSVLILDNSALERVELFLVSMTALPGLFPVAVTNSPAVVSLMDNDGEAHVACRGVCMCMHTMCCLF